MEPNEVNEVKIEENIIDKPEGDGTSSGHSGHHHHHHHHRHRKKSKFRKFLKKHDKMIKIGAIVASLLIVTLIAFLVDRSYNSENKETSESGDVQESIDSDVEYVYMGVPIFEDEVRIMDTVAWEYIHSTDMGIYEVTDKYDLKGRHDIGCGVELRFGIKYLPVGTTVISAKAEISENKDFENALFYTLDKLYSARIYNLKSSTEYYYNAHFTMSDGKVYTYGGSFKTEAGVRMLKVDGIFNVRDVGGWTTVDGKTVSQGLLYRGSELDGAVEASCKLTDEGCKVLIMQLGIKTDMDLRKESDSAPGMYVLGSNIAHKYYGSSMYAAVFDEGKEAMRKVFADLANPTSYPVYLHCTYGVDRTGTVCYILGALLGVSEQDLIKDYELSGFFTKDLERDNIMKVYKGLQSFEGASLKEKAENYLLSIGVTKQEIDAVRYIFLGE